MKYEKNMKVLILFFAEKMQENNVLLLVGAKDAVSGKGSVRRPRGQEVGEWGILYFFRREPEPAPQLMIERIVSSTGASMICTYSFLR